MDSLVFWFVSDRLRLLGVFWALRCFDGWIPVRASREQWLAFWKWCWVVCLSILLAWIKVYVRVRFDSYKWLECVVLCGCFIWLHEAMYFTILKLTIKSTIPFFKQKGRNISWIHILVLLCFWRCSLLSTQKDTVNTTPKPNVSGSDYMLAFRYGGFTASSPLHLHTHLILMWYDAMFKDVTHASIKQPHYWGTLLTAH